MKRVYKCEYCDEIFSNETEALQHEEKCGYNPKNTISDKLIFRLSMIYHDLQDIISSALHEVAKDELSYLYAETKRADNTNCAFMIKENQGRMLWALSGAKTITHKEKGVKLSKYEFVLKNNPEIFKAIVDTLKRKAWNE